jgi:hypothetical protein
METNMAGSTRAGRGGTAAEAHDDGRTERSVAQTVCLVLGGILVLAGLVGFTVNSDFSTGSNPPGDTLLGLEVNGWHNIAHIATGGLLLLGVRNARLAATVLLAFAGSYVVVALWGFVAGDNVVQLLAINSADNWFHVFLILVAGAAGLSGLKGVNDAGTSGRRA